MIAIEKQFRINQTLIEMYYSGEAMWLFYYASASSQDARYLFFRIRV